MEITTTQQYPIRLSQMHQRPAHTPWWGLSNRFSQLAEQRKLLIRETSVRYPDDLGIHRGASPLTCINHHFTVERLRVAIDLLNADACPGIDGETVESFKWRATDAYLEDLVHQVRSRRFYPQPNRWATIEKYDGSDRVLGIPCVEDRAVQRTWLLIVEPAFERKFLDCSYGYRPGRSCHQAVEKIAEEIGSRGNLWVLDADFKGYFDSVPHDKLMDCLRRHVTDPVFLTFCHRTLQASIKADGECGRSALGVPQGGIVSPMLSNIYAHEALDLHFEFEIRPRLRGRARLFRYADDYVVLTESEDDAKLVKELIEIRVSQYGLTLHPTKTTIRNMTCPELQPPVTEDDHRELLFLGYELSWHQTGRGRWELVGRTAPGRRAKALQRWSERLDGFRQELKEYRRKHPRRVEPKFIERLDRSVLDHIVGFTSYYLAEGNETELSLYENGVYRLAAGFWEQYIDQRGPNPYEGRADVIWPQIRLRNICELSSKHNQLREKGPTGTEAG